MRLTVDTTARDCRAGRLTAVGMVFQFHHLFAHLTALAERLAGAGPRAAASRAEAERAGRELLDSWRRRPRRRRCRTSCPGGEAQRVAIARALAVEPRAADGRADGVARSAPPRRAGGDASEAWLRDGTHVVVATHDDGVRARVRRSRPAAAGRPRRPRGRTRRRAVIESFAPHAAGATSTPTRATSSSTPSGRSATATSCTTAFNHWPIWIFVFFIAPGPLTFDLFERGFDSADAGVAWRRAGRHRHRRAARPASRLRAGALHHPVHRGPAEPALPPRLLHDRVGRGGRVRGAEHRRAGLRSGDRRVAAEADVRGRVLPDRRHDVAARRAAGCCRA